MHLVARLGFIFLLSVFSVFCLPFSANSQQKKKYPESAYPEHMRLVLPKLIPYRNGKLWGYADSTGTVKIAPKYTMAQPFEGKLAVVRNGETANVIDLKGKELFKWQHRGFFIWHGRLIFGETKARQYGVYSSTGKEIIPPIYRSAFLLNQNDKKNPLIVAWTETPPVPDANGISRTGPVQTHGLFSEQGQLILPVIYHGIKYLGAGIIQAYKDRNFYYFDLKGNALPMFEGYRLESFNKGAAVYFNNGKYGLIDSTGIILVPPQYDDAKAANARKTAVKSNGSWAIMEQSGRLLTPFKFAEPAFFMNGFAIAQTGRNGYGLLDSLGNEVTPFTFTYIYGAKPGKIYAFNTNNVVRYGIVTKVTGKVEILNDITDLKFFTDGLAAAVKYGKKGFIDENGQEVIPFEYAETRWFTNGLAAVYNGNGWGVINKQNEVVIPFSYPGLEVINRDRFIVTLFNRPAWFMKAIMNAKGQEIVPLKYTEISQPELDRIMVGRGNEWGLIDLTGKELIKLGGLPLGYTPNESYKNGIQQLINKQTNKLGYRDWKGRLYFKD